MNIFDVIIVGAGASGLMLASCCKKNYLILEANEKIGKKIRISGGGKCNITNKIVSYKNYIGDKEFIERVLKNFTQKDILKFFAQILPEITKNTQYFCKTSMDVISFFEKKVPKNKIILNCKVMDIEYSGNLFFIKTNREDYK